MLREPLTIAIAVGVALFFCAVAIFTVLDECEPGEYCIGQDAQENKTP